MFGAKRFHNTFNGAPVDVCGCIGVVEARTAEITKALAMLRYRPMVLDVACADDPWRAERALESGQRRLRVAITYSQWDEEWDRIGRDSGACVDMVYTYAGLLVPCSCKAAVQALDHAMHARVGPIWLGADDRSSILAKAGGKCWLCGKTHPDGLYVQEMLPYFRPKFVQRGGAFSISMPSGDPGTCRALCRDCASAWRACFEANVRRLDHRWMKAHEFDGFGGIIQGRWIESDDDAELAKLRSVAAACVEEYKSKDDYRADIERRLGSEED